MLKFPKQWLLLAIVLALAAQFAVSFAAPRKKNYYELLNVQKEDDAKTIKRSYFKLAMKYHPDKNPDVADRATLEKHFSELSHAYQVLSAPKTREKYDSLLKQGVKEYTTEDIKNDEAREDMHTEFRNSFEVFNEAERMSAEEEKQVLIDKAILITMGCGIIGIGVWYMLNSRKMRKAIGIQNPSTNVNTSVGLQQAIGHDRERQLEEIEKLRLKEEKERLRAEKILEIVERRRLALAEEEEARLAAEETERENQRAIMQARREADQAEDSNDESSDSENSNPLTAQGVDDPLDPQLDYIPKAVKNADFHCKPCRKSFKSEEQLENHLASKKHKQLVKELERPSKRATSSKEQQ